MRHQSAIGLPFRDHDVLVLCDLIHDGKAFALNSEALMFGSLGFSSDHGHVHWSKWNDKTDK